MASAGAWLTFIVRSSAASGMQPRCEMTTEYAKMQVGKGRGRCAASARERFYQDGAAPRVSKDRLENHGDLAVPSTGRTCSQGSTSHRKCTGVSTAWVRETTVFAR